MSDGAPCWGRHDFGTAAEGQLLTWEVTSPAAAVFVRAWVTCARCGLFGERDGRREVWEWLRTVVALLLPDYPGWQRVGVRAWGTASVTKTGKAAAVMDGAAVDYAVERGLAGRKLEEI